MIHYALENQRVAKEYLVNYTNAAFVIKEGFKLPDDGLYSGFDPADADLRQVDLELRRERRQRARTSAGRTRAACPPNVAYDTSLENPRCVYQLLKKQYSRYTPEMVERITGIPKDQFLKAADLFTSIRKDGDTKKVGTIIYAVGWTQHSFGSQIIRTAAMLQLLLGNVGRAGGGVNALRGHSNIQGATDMAGIFDNPAGLSEGSESGRQGFRRLDEAHHAHFFQAQGMGFVELLVEHAQVRGFVLKSMYGDAATKENDWAFDYLPKVDREYSWVAHLGRHVPGQSQRPDRVRHERRRHRPQFAEEHRRAEESRLAGGLRHLSG